MSQRSVRLIQLLPCILQIMQLGAQAISSREVMCTRDSIDIMMRFDESFGGQLYAKNFYDRTACRTGGSRQRRLQLSISHNSCGVINDIDLNTYEVTLVVQNHPDVILDGDVSYRVTCEYDNQGDSVTLDVSLDANELPVDPIVRTSFTPTLALKILPGDITRSDPVSVVEVGDDLNLVIEMLNTDVFDNFFVHTCVATDEKDGSITLVDEHGCVSDDVPGMIESSRVRTRTRPLRKYIAIKAFKFPGQIMVKFTCVANLCLPSQTACPLQCTGSDTRERVKREMEELRGTQVAAPADNDTDPRPIDRQQLANAIRVIAPQLGDDDDHDDDDGIRQSGKRPDPPTSRERQFCVSVVWLAVGAATVGAVLLILICACVCVFVRARATKKKHLQLEASSAGVVRRSVTEGSTSGFPCIGMFKVSELHPENIYMKSRRGADAESLREQPSMHLRI